MFTLPIPAPVHRLVAVVAPLRATAGSAATPPGDIHVDPLVVGLILLGIGALYAGIVLVAVCAVRWPKGMRRSRAAHWPEGGARKAVGESLRESWRGSLALPAPFASARPEGSHRPLAARRASSAHPPTSGLSPAPLSDATSRGSQKGDRVTQPARPAGEAWPDIEREIEGVGTVRWDGRTVRAFAGQPEVLQRLAFHRWRYHEGRCSEFAAPANTPRTPGEQGRAAARRDVGQPGRDARSSPRPERHSRHETAVAQPTGGVEPA